MCGFDDDWSCPTRSYADGRPIPCPEGGCPMGCCARDRQDEIELLTGERPDLLAVAQS